MDPREEVVDELGLEIAHALDLKPLKTNYGKSLFLGMAWGAIIGGVATFLGGARNPLAVGMLALAGLMVVSGISGSSWSSDPRTPTLSPATVALRGSWEGLDPTDAPRRLVVEQVHPEWAVVHYHWGDHPIGKVQPGWVRVRAKVHPEGKLFWQYGGDFTFRLSADRTTLAFGTVSVASRSQAQPLWLTNTGSTNLDVTAVSVNGPFALATGGTCASSSFTVAPGQACLLLVEFAPMASGAASGTLSIVSNAGTLSVALAGDGFAAPNAGRDVGAGGSPSNTGGGGTLGPDVLALLRRLNDEFKKTIVMVTHDPRAAERAHTQHHLEKGVLRD